MLAGMHMKMSQCVSRVLYVSAITAIISVGTPANAQFAQQGGKLVGTGAVGDYVAQGQSVALSGDGNTALVGGPFDDTIVGASWVFTRSGGVWAQQGFKLRGADASYQGYSVALSRDGNTAIIGAPAPTPDSSGGAVIFTRSGGVWTQQGPKLIGTEGTVNQGLAVALSGDGNTAIVGGYNDGGGLGAAWVFSRSGGVWTQQGGKLVGSNAGGVFVWQGFSVALSYDGNTALVGGPHDNIGVGAAWVFTRSGGVWTQQGGKLVGVSAVRSGMQGASVALSSDGNTAILGGPNYNLTGAAWVFTRSSGLWTQQGGPLVGTGGVDYVGQGYSVALSGDGNTALVGGPYDNNGVGAVWSFTRSAGVWAQQGPKAIGTGAVGPAWQGGAVALSGDGNTAVVGGMNDNTTAGAAWAFARVFAGTPGTANCRGQSITKLANQYGGLNAAAKALGYGSVQALQSAINAYCGG